MSHAAPSEKPKLSFDDRNHFLLRKLHSLSGIVPVGFFLIEHLLTNSSAFNWPGVIEGGPKVFNEKVHWLHGLPYLFFLEVLFIFAPLAFHAGYGVKIALTAEPNYGKYRYGSNLRYTLQRASGWIALIFIVVHLLKFRFAHLVGWGPEFIHEGNDYYAITRDGLHHWYAFGNYGNENAFTMPAILTFGFYVLGLWAAVFHFCNGIWTFCISWGITVGAQAQKKMGYVCVAIAIVLLAWGHASLGAFWTDATGPTRPTRTGHAATEARGQMN
jgi:succinate dehydrogenase / fumarate reductase cytochrome b subunit